MLRSAPQQIPLDIGYREIPGLNDFITGSNKPALETLKKIAAGDETGQIYLWGSTGTGKSHLLNAACMVAGEHKLSAIYIPLTNYRDLQPLMLEGMDNMNLVCVDDIDCIAGDIEWEQAMFHLYNRIRDAGGSMIISGSANLQAMDLKLEDLRSRLYWDLVFHLEPLSDADKINVLQQRALRKGFELTAEVAEYLAKRVQRDLPNLIQLLNYFDKESLAAQKKITIPFVRSLLDKDSKQN